MVSISLTRPNALGSVARFLTEGGPLGRQTRTDAYGHQREELSPIGGLLRFATEGGVLGHLGSEDGKPNLLGKITKFFFDGGILGHLHFGKKRREPEYAQGGGYQPAQPGIYPTNINVGPYPIAQNGYNAGYGNHAGGNYDVSGSPRLARIKDVADGGSTGLRTIKDAIDGNNNGNGPLKILDVIGGGLLSALA